MRLNPQFGKASRLRKTKHRCRGFAGRHHPRARGTRSATSKSASKDSRPSALTHGQTSSRCRGTPFSTSSPARRPGSISRRRTRSRRVGTALLPLRPNCSGATGGSHRSSSGGFASRPRSSRRLRRHARGYAERAERDGYATGANLATVRRTRWSSCPDRSGPDHRRRLHRIDLDTEQGIASAVLAIYFGLFWVTLS
jgi:hypothetical protein